MMNILNEIGKEQIRTDLPQLNIGDTVHVYIKVKEGTRETFMFRSRSLPLRHLEVFSGQRKGLIRLLQVYHILGTE